MEFERKFKDKYNDHHDPYVVRQYFYKKNDLINKAPEIKEQGHGHGHGHGHGKEEA